MGREMSQIYQDPNREGSLGDVDALFHDIRGKADRREVKEWLIEQNVYFQPIELFGREKKTSNVVCLQCNQTSDRYEHFMDLILDIQNADSLEKAIEQFVKSEFLEDENAYKCSKCDTLVTAEKTVTIHRPPNVATFQLKRFHYYPSYGKITKSISYPESFDLRPYMSRTKGGSLLYQLNAVLVHEGRNCNSGHYYCYVTNSNGHWYLMDDEEVKEVSLGDVLNEQAYVLFYVRSTHNNTHFEVGKTVL